MFAFENLGLLTYASKGSSREISFDLDLRARILRELDVFISEVS